MLDHKSAGILVELTGKIEGAAQIVIGTGINMSICRVEENVVSQGWTNLQEVGINIGRNIPAARLIRKLRAVLVLFEHGGLALYLSR